MVAERKSPGGLSVVEPVPKKTRLIDIGELDLLALLHENLCDINEIAEMLGVSVDTVKSFCIRKPEDNRLPHAVIAREYKFFKMLVQWWLVNEQQI